jgi:hypothetical protein
MFSSQLKKHSLLTELFRLDNPVDVFVLSNFLDFSSLIYHEVRRTFWSQFRSVLFFCIVFLEFQYMSDTSRPRLEQKNSWIVNKAADT